MLGLERTTEKFSDRHDGVNTSTSDLMLTKHTVFLLMPVENQYADKPILKYNHYLLLVYASVHKHLRWVSDITKPYPQRVKATNLGTQLKIKKYNN